MPEVDWWYYKFIIARHFIEQLYAVLFRFKEKKEKKKNNYNTEYDFAYLVSNGDGTEWIYILCNVQQLFLFYIRKYIYFRIKTEIINESLKEYKLLIEIKKKKKRF